MLVLMSGLPGSGKSAIAAELGVLLPAVVLSVDPIEAAMWRCGIDPSFATGVAAYEIATVVAESQLRLGHTVVGDAVNSSEVARDMWRGVARRAGSPMTIVEVICSDDELHQTRLAGRSRNIEGFPEPTWNEVLARRDEWETWPEERLVLDSVESLVDNIERAFAYVRR